MGLRGVEPVMLLFITDGEGEFYLVQGLLAMWKSQLRFAHLI